MRFYPVQERQDLITSIIIPEIEVVAFNLTPNFPKRQIAALYHAARSETRSLGLLSYMRISPNVVKLSTGRMPNQRLSSKRDV